jgi:hypothetical protein
MPKGDYPAGIEGIRFFGHQELPPVSTSWNFQTAKAFPIDSARRLLSKLPEDCQISFFDPEAGHEEAWLFVRRVGQRYFVQRVRHGCSPPWNEESLESIITSFVSSPLVKMPSDAFESFTISSIPDHQRYDHINKKT